MPTFCRFFHEKKLLFIYLVNRPVFGTACRVFLYLYHFQSILRSFWDSFVHVFAFFPSFRRREDKTRFGIRHPFVTTLSSLSPWTSETDFCDTSRRFLMPRTSESCFSEVLTSDWTFLYLPIVIAQPGPNMFILNNINL